MKLRYQPRQQRGFTLVELMVVVVIVGVLATLAVFGVTKYSRAAKTSEATSIIAMIKAAQEAYKEETFQYKDVSGNYTTLYPNANPGNFKTQWGGGGGTVPANWLELGVQTSAPVYYGYAVVARGPGVALPNPPTTQNFGFPATPEPSYCAIAVGDLDADGTRSYVVGHSFSAEIYVEREGE